MYHGVAHLDPGREPIEDETADLALQNCEQAGKLTEILLRAMNRRGEMAFERAGNLKELIAVRVPHEKRCGAKDLRIQARAKKRSRVGFKKRGAYGKPGTRRRFRSLGNERDGCVCLPPGERRIVRGINAPGQQMERRRSGDQLPQFFCKRGGLLPCGRNTIPGLV